MTNYQKIIFGEAGHARAKARQAPARHGYNVDRDTQNNPDNFWQGTARQGKARHGKARQGYNVDRDTQNNPDNFWRGEAGLGEARLGVAWHGYTWTGTRKTTRIISGVARRGTAQHGEAGLGVARLKRGPGHGKNPGNFLAVKTTDKTKNNENVTCKMDRNTTALDAQRAVERSFKPHR